MFLIPFFARGGCRSVPSSHRCVFEHCSFEKSIAPYDVSCRWVEFIDKKVAKRVASSLNGEQIGMSADCFYMILYRNYMALNFVI